MKSKRSTYFLLFSAVGVWSYVIYTIVSGLSFEDKISHTIQPIYGSIKMAKLDTFQLLLSYDDPFLGKEVAPAPKIKKSGPKPVKQPTLKPVKDVQWPDLLFLGGITNQATGQEIFMLQVSGVGHMVKQGDIIGELKILEVSTDIITLEYKEQTKTITK